MINSPKYTMNWLSLLVTEKSHQEDFGLIYIPNVTTYMYPATDIDIGH